MPQDDLIEALKALAHPLRFTILTALAAGERNVGEIEQATGIGQPALSQQLGVLRKAGLVDTRKQAKLVFYSHASNHLSAVVAALGALGASGAAPTPQTAPDGQRVAFPGAANFARMS